MASRAGTSLRAPRRAFRGLGLAFLPAAFLLAAGAELLSACNKGDGAPRDPVLVKGQATYNLRCGSCHHPDPARDGTLGPAVKGASLELLRARVLHGTYPPGYTPKRSTKIMQKLPLTEADIAAIHAFLNKP